MPINATTPAACALSAQLTDQTLATESTADCTDGYRLNSTGKAQHQQQGSFFDLEWWRLVGVSAAFECRATLNSGSLTNGTTGTWLALSTSRLWNIVRTTVGTTNADLTIDIRLAGTTTIIATAHVTLSATKSL